MKSFEFRCGMTGNMAFECLEKDGRKLEGRTHIVEVEPTVVDNEVIVFHQEQGEILVMRNTLLQSRK